VGVVNRIVLFIKTYVFYKKTVGGKGVEMIKREGEKELDI
jgi:hypothetical protein